MRLLWRPSQWVNIYKVLRLVSGMELVLVKCFMLLLVLVDCLSLCKSMPRIVKIGFIIMKWSVSRSVVSDSLQLHGLYSPWNSPGQNTGVGSLSLLQGIFPTQGSNPGLLHYRQILYQLSHEGKPVLLYSRIWKKKKDNTWVLILKSIFVHLMPQETPWTRLSQACIWGCTARGLKLSQN